MGKATDAVYMNYGNFVQEIVQFLIIAFAIFLVIKGVAILERKKEAEPSAPTKTEELLADIRDLLKK